MRNRTILRHPAVWFTNLYACLCRASTQCDSLAISAWDIDPGRLFDAGVTLTEFRKRMSVAPILSDELDRVILVLRFVQIKTTNAMSWATCHVLKNPCIAFPRACCGVVVNEPKT